jgi:histone deacetylase complex regulatory component SIN3
MILINSLYHQIHVIFTDTQSQQLLGIFQHEHRAEIENQNDLITYRTRVAGVVKQVENTYHMAFVSVYFIMTMEPSC